MSTMLLVPLEDIVVFPNMNVTLTVDVGSEERVLLVPRSGNDYASVGTVANVTLGGSFVNVNDCRAGVGSGSPALSTARMTKVGIETPFGVNTVNTVSTLGVIVHRLES